MRKFAIVTGGSRGIGFAVAKYLAKSGYDLALIARDQAKLTEAKLAIEIESQDAEVSIYASDIGDAEKSYQLTQKICQSTKQVDVLFNNAGVALAGTNELSISDMQSMLNINVMGVFAVAKAVLEKMAEQKSGYIMNLSSMSGRRSLPRMGGYGASKFAVSGLTEALFAKYVPQGIQVTAICPGVIDTDMTRGVNLENNDKIQLTDIVATVDYLLTVGRQAAIPFIEMRNSALVGKDGSLSNAKKADQPLENA